MCGLWLDGVNVAETYASQCRLNGAWVETVVFSDTDEAEVGVDNSV